MAKDTKLADNNIKKFRIVYAFTNGTFLFLKT